MKLFTSKNQKIGEIGENIVSKFLKKEGYLIVERNYTRKYGEIDIVAKRTGVLYFFEVKTVSCEITSNTLPEMVIRPEENMHAQKIRKFKNTVLAYLAQNLIDENMPWQIDLICVYVDIAKNKARINRFENIQ